MSKNNQITGFRPHQGDYFFYILAKEKAPKTKKATSFRPHQGDYFFYFNVCNQ